MNQRCLNHAVAHVTGESVETIAKRGFSLLDPEIPEFGDEVLPIEWDKSNPYGVALHPLRRQPSISV